MILHHASLFPSSKFSGKSPKERKKETKMQNHQSCGGPLVKETKRSQLGQEALKERKRERE